MKNIFFIFAVITLISLASCADRPSSEDISLQPTVITQTPTLLPTSMPSVSEAADAMIDALAENDLQAVAAKVHPELGVRFSPYAFVRDDHLVFMPHELPGLMESEEVFTWGNYDGSGEPIMLRFSQYYQEFVYSADFAHAEQITVNTRLGQGNSINNIEDYYPGSSYVEYHFSGFDLQYEGMDWESLRLVFVQEQGQWWLVGIVHDQWTI